MPDDRSRAAPAALVVCGLMLAGSLWVALPFADSAQARRGSPQRQPTQLDFLERDARELVVAGKYPDAIAVARKTLADREKEAVPDRLGSAYYQLGEVLRLNGKYAAAKDAFERALKIYEPLQVSLPGMMVIIRARLAAILMQAGDPRAAKPLLDSALALAEKELHPTDFRLAQVLTTFGRYYENLGDYSSAKGFFDRSLKLQQAIRQPNSNPVANSMQQLANLYRKAGDPAAARPLLERALAIRERNRGASHPEVAETLSHLALALENTRDYSGARTSYERALAIVRGTEQAETRRNAAFGLGRINEQENRLTEALALYQESVRMLENSSAQFEQESQRALYLQAGDKLAVYDALARVLLKLHETEAAKDYDKEAWAVLEAKKGRVVAEVLTASNPQFQDPETRKEVEAAKSAQDQAGALQRELVEEQAKPVEEQQPEKVRNLTTLLAQTKGDYLKQVQTFLAKYPQYRTQFVDQQSVDPRALAKFADRLPDGTLAIQFFPSPDALYLFVVAPGGRFQVKRQGVSQAELYKLIKEYRAHLERAAAQRLSWSDDGSEAYRREVLPFKELTRKLSEYVLGPIATELAAHKNLVLIPNDLLLYLPIHALTHSAPDGSNALLAETHVISYMTQLELADIINPGKPRPDAPLLALANPDGSLPAASREVREIGKIRSGVTALDGEQATKERFLSLAGKFPDLHLATHGVLDPAQPEKSYLLMAGEDEKLTIAEIAGLRLQPHGIAILSACQTAVGEQIPGAALITLAAAFSQAGSQSIMASLWEVGDFATRDLMVAFYGALAKSGRAGALQQAQLALLKNPLTAHPYYWAPFILIGAR
jgi:CHAT domain-containing protein